MFLRSSDHVAPSDDETLRVNVRSLLISALPPDFNGPPRLADAVGVAALSAAAENRPRAVLLLVADADDGSTMPVEWVRAFLRALRVPLTVWTKDKILAAAWGKVDVLTGLSDVENAVSSLTELVERQRIVWLEGRHLPQSISLSPKSRNVTLIE